MISLIGGLLMSTLAFTACGGDDDSTESSSSDNQSLKRLTKIISEKGSNITVRLFSYDSEGRIVKIVETSSNSNSERTFQYGESNIISKWEIKYSNSSTQSTSHTYTLENGMIVKDVELFTHSAATASTSTTIYSYDSNGYMTSKSKYQSITDDTRINYLTWEDGNISKIGDNAYTYSNTPWVKGFPIYWGGIDPYLFSFGYFGKTPKNSPDTEGDYTYDYTLEGSYVTKIVETNTYTQTVNTLFWE